ncbi:MAG: peptidylprolyl isomerase [Planctomycetota bacterium]
MYPQPRGLTLATAVLLTIAATAAESEATIVRFRTSLGDIVVRLFDTATPASVDNFLNYVNDGDYTESFIHRLPTDFVAQGGGFAWPADSENVISVPTDAPVANEPGLSNLEGTLAYAKLGGDPDSATSGWFFSLGDNSANLDFQNGGFTVFGRVVGNGMDVLDDINQLQVVNIGGAFSSLPVLESFTSPTVDREDLLFVDEVQIRNFTPGDYNFDGSVTLADLATWQNQLGNSLRIVDQPATTRMEADGNGDGVVDAADYTVWRDSFNAASASAVPEPISAMLAALGVASVPLRRR